MEHVQFLLDHVVDVDHHVRSKRGGFLEAVAEVGDDGVGSHRRDVGADVWDADHVGRVLNQDRRVAVVGVVVVGTVGEDEVGRVAADHPDDFLAVLGRRFEFAVVVVHDVVFDPGDRCC